MRAYRTLIGAYHSEVETRIRLASADDADEIARMRWEFSGEEREPSESYGSFTSRMTSAIRGFLEGGRWSIWVAEHPDSEEHLIAVTFLERVEKVPRPYARPAAWGYITNVYVDAAWRDRGIGGALIGRAVAAARDEGLDTLLLWPSRRAIPFYERAGFSPAIGAMELSLDEA